MDTRRLKAFLTIVETGSLTRAAAALHIAQPALSQQVAGLEGYFGRKLLIRSQQGVTPTDAGQVLYRHAQAILRQLEQAESDIKGTVTTLSGYVSVGLAPYSGAVTLAFALLTTVRERYPNILVRIVEGFAVTFSELLMNGRLDIAVMHGTGPIRGISFQPLATEEFCLVAPIDQPLAGDPDSAVALKDLAAVPLLLPSRHNFVRRAIDIGFASLHLAPLITAEVESLSTLREAVAAGAGATILPWSVANEVATPARSVIRAIEGPRIDETVSLCLSDNAPLSEATMAVRTVLAELTLDAARAGRWLGARRPAAN